MAPRKTDSNRVSMAVSRPETPTEPQTSANSTTRCSAASNPSRPTGLLPSTPSFQATIQVARRTSTVHPPRLIPFIDRSLTTLVMVHINATTLPNNTISGGTISHVGQVFFDQSLISAVEAVAPYKSNTQPLTTNEQDFIMAQEAETTDPIMHYTLLGNKVEDGLFGWIAFGVDAKANKTVSAAANYGKGGGKANPNAGFPGGIPFPSGGFPSGFPGFPSGFPSGFPGGFPSGFPMPPGGPRPTQSTPLVRSSRPRQTAGPA